MAELMTHSMKSPIFLFVFFLQLLLVSCTVFEQSSKIAESPTFGSEPGLENSLILFMDDFTDPASGWQTMGSVSGSSVKYEHQGLRLMVNEPETDYWSIQAINIQDVQLAVDASKISGPDDNTFGLICRFSDGNQFYAFLVSSDGYYAILKVNNGDYTLLSGDHMDFNPAIRPYPVRPSTATDCRVEIHMVTGQ